MDWYRFTEIRFKSTCVIYAASYVGIGGRCDACLPKWDTNVCRVCWISVELCLAPEITSWYDQPLGDSYYLQRSFSEKLVTAKEGVSFTLASLTNISHQVNPRILHGPCFVSCMKDEPMWWLLNMHLTYNPPSSWRILFWYGGCPGQFSRPKKFRALVVPFRGFNKGIILQGRQLTSGLTVTGHPCLRIKGDVMEASVHASRHRNSRYIQTVRWSIYKTRWPENPHPPIHRYEQRPSWTQSTSPLHNLDISNCIIYIYPLIDLIL